MCGLYNVVHKDTHTTTVPRAPHVEGRRCPRETLLSKQGQLIGPCFLSLICELSKEPGRSPRIEECSVWEKKKTQWLDLEPRDGRRNQELERDHLE